MYKIVIFSILSLITTLLTAQTGTIKHHASGYVNTEESVEQTTLELDWLSPSESEVSKGLVTYTDAITLKWEARSSQTFDNITFEPYVDDRYYRPKQGKMDEVPLKTVSGYGNSGNYRQSYEQKIRLTQYGVYKIDAVLKRNGTIVKRSSVLSVTYKPTPVEPIRLYVLAVGPHFTNLAFTQKDAQDFSKLFKNQENRLYKSVEVQTLVGDNVTSNLVLNQLDIIKKKYLNRELTDKDLVILFFSGHGDYNDNNSEKKRKFYINLSLYNPERPEKTGLNWVEIKSALNEVNCKKMLFIDACKSGTLDPFDLRAKDADPETLARAQSEQFGASPGWAIFTSSNAEKSWEHLTWENGAFTEAIQEGLAGGKADADGNKIITIIELNDYLAKRVPALIREVAKRETGMQLQYPQLKNPNLDQNMGIYEVR
jgi:Caspase domain